MAKFNEFAVGRIVSTPGAIGRMELYSQGRPPAIVAGELLARHMRGDWGTLDREDIQANNRATDPNDPTRILSNYELVAGESYSRIWIITEWDRSVTTFLTPEEY